MLKTKDLLQDFLCKCKCTGKGHAFIAKMRMSAACGKNCLDLNTEFNNWKYLCQSTRISFGGAKKEHWTKTTVQIFSSSKVMYSSIESMVFHRWVLD